MIFVYLDKEPPIMLLNQNPKTSETRKTSG